MTLGEFLGMHRSVYAVREGYPGLELPPALDRPRWRIRPEGMAAWLVVALALAVVLGLIGGGK